MIKLLCQFTLVILKFYQEKGQQTIDYIRQNPTEAPLFFNGIKVDIYNIQKVLESLDEQIDIFEYDDVKELIEYRDHLEISMKTMNGFLSELETIVESDSEDNDFKGLDFSSFKFESTDGGAA